MSNILIYEEKIKERKNMLFMLHEILGQKKFREMIKNENDEKYIYNYFNSITKKQNNE